MGSSETSCPRAISSAASALSRRQLPQYMPPAPAVMSRTLTVAPSRGGPLDRAPLVEVLEQVALGRLVPADPHGGNRAQVHPLHERRRQEPPAQRYVLGDGGQRERRAQDVGQLLGPHLHDRSEREQELAIGQGM